MYKKTTLSNGLRIITVPAKNTKAVTVMALVAAGSKYETREINGISHFLEHLFFKGTAKRGNSIEVAETIDKVGGIYNAFTGQDYAGYYAKVASKHADLAMDWVSDIYLNSLLPPDEIEKERGVIAEEFNMYYDNPMLYLGEMWPRLLYGDQPAGWAIVGTKDTIFKMTREQMAAYRGCHYVAANTIVIVAGNINQSKAEKLAKKYFSAIGTSIPLSKGRVLEEQNAPALLAETRKTDQTNIAIGVRAFDLFNPRRYAFELLATILGGMMSSRLFVEVREKMGIAYDIKTDFTADADAGYLVTVAGMDTGKADIGIATILREYKKIAESPVPQGELKKSKDNYIGKMILTLESSNQLATFYAMQDLLEGTILEPEQVYKKIEEVTAADIQAAAREIFKPERLNLALIGPQSDTERFAKIMDGAL